MGIINITNKLTFIPFLLQIIPQIQEQAVL
jgi:hypothetical protein